MAQECKRYNSLTELSQFTFTLSFCQRTLIRTIDSPCCCDGPLCVSWLSFWPIGSSRYDHLTGHVLPPLPQEPTSSRSPRPQLATHPDHPSICGACFSSGQLKTSHQFNHQDPCHHVQMSEEHRPPRRSNQAPLPKV